MLSKSCIYAIKIMIYLSLQQTKNGLYMGVTEVSEAIDSPKHFTAKILQQLSKAKLLESQAGPNGGFRFSKEKDVSLADIIRIIDGDELLDGCILGFKECSDLCPCPIHTKYVPLRSYLREVLITTHLEELKQIVENKNAFLKR